MLFLRSERAFYRRDSDSGYQSFLDLAVPRFDTSEGVFHVISCHQMPNIAFANPLIQSYF